MNKKRLLLITLLTIFVVLSILDTSQMLLAAKETLALWAGSVVPSLMPFMFAAQALNLLGAPAAAAKALGFIPAALGYGRDAAFPMIVSLLCGYPAGAKLLGTLYPQNAQACQSLAPLCHTSGPLFLLLAAPVLINAPGSGPLIMLCHYGGVLCAAACVAPACPPPAPQLPRRLLPVSAVLFEACSYAVNTLLTVGGMMLFFGVLARFARLNVFTAVLELGCGLKALESCPFKLPAAAFALSFSGLCVLAQAVAFMPAGVRFGRIAAVRLLAGVLSALLAVLAARSVPVAAGAAIAFTLAAAAVRTRINKKRKQNLQTTKIFGSGAHAQK